MTSFAAPGDAIYFKSRNCDDLDPNPNAPEDPGIGDPQCGTVHLMADPVRIEGAKARDMLKMTIQEKSWRMGLYVDRWWFFI
jgi:acetamidase/formamidase